GRSDFLVPEREAARSHALIGPSTLVYIDASHFIPLMQAERAAGVLGPFFARHDAPGVPGVRQTVELAADPPGLFGAAGAAVERAFGAAPWWVLAAIIAGAVAWRDRVMAVIAAMLVSFLVVDFGVAMAGILAGQAVIAARAWRRGAA